MNFRWLVFLTMFVSLEATGMTADDIKHSFFIAGPTFTGIIDEDGKEAWDSGKAAARDGLVLPSGNYLVPHVLALKVKEYSATGEVLKEFPTDMDSLGGREAKNWPFTAIR